MPRPRGNRGDRSRPSARRLRRRRRAIRRTRWRERRSRARARTRRYDEGQAPWQRLYFLPEPHQQGSLRPRSRCSLTACGCIASGEVGAEASCGRCAPGGGDRICAGGGLVLVVELASGRLDGFERRRLELDGDMEQREDDLLADRLAELLEEHVALAPILDERILLRERAQMDALTEVVHRLEVVAPALVDDLEDHVALDVARELGGRAPARAARRCRARRRRTPRAALRDP